MCVKFRCYLYCRLCVFVHLQQFKQFKNYISKSHGTAAKQDESKKKKRNKYKLEKKFNLRTELQQSDYFFSQQQIQYYNVNNKNNNNCNNIKKNCKIFVNRATKPAKKSQQNREPNKQPNFFLFLLLTRSKGKVYTQKKNINKKKIT